MTHHQGTPDILQQHLDSLARIIGTRAATTGDFATPIAGVSLFRRDSLTQPVICMVPPSIVVIAQGASRMWVGGDSYPSDASKFLITSLDLPAKMEVTHASTRHPCMGLTLQLDQRALSELIAEGNLPMKGARVASSGVGIATVSAVILAPLRRLLELMDEPEAIPVLAPLIQREIFYRLLMSDQSPHLRQIASVDDQGYRIARAIDWLKLNYASPLRIAELASRVQMSAPSFHQHFRQLTGISPLQYQKCLRLNEAKRLMLSEYMDVSTAAFSVGYESPSQFSREYRRLFDVSPKQNVMALRGLAGENKVSQTPVRKKTPR